MVEQTSAATHSLREEISRLAGRVSGFRTALAAPAHPSSAPTPRHHAPKPARRIHEPA
jgi:methyl-accepting chemotaxis protein